MSSTVATDSHSGYIEENNIKKKAKTNEERKKVPGKQDHC
jgi:hypothetical protein